MPEGCNLQSLIQKRIRGGGTPDCPPPQQIKHMPWQSLCLVNAELLIRSSNSSCYSGPPPHSSLGTTALVTSHTGRTNWWPQLVTSKFFPLASGASSNGSNSSVSLHVTLSTGCEQKGLERRDFVWLRHQRDQDGVPLSESPCSCWMAGF